MEKQYNVLFNLVSRLRSSCPLTCRFIALKCVSVCIIYKQEYYSLNHNTTIKIKMLTLKYYYHLILRTYSWSTVFLIMFIIAKGSGSKSCFTLVGHVSLVSFSLEQFLGHFILKITTQVLLGTFEFDISPDWIQVMLF